MTIKGSNESELKATLQKAEGTYRLARAARTVLEEKIAAIKSGQNPDRWLFRKMLEELRPIDERLSQARIEMARIRISQCQLEIPKLRLEIEPRRRAFEESYKRFLAAQVECNRLGFEYDEARRAVTGREESIREAESMIEELERTSFARTAA